MRIGKLIKKYVTLAFIGCVILSSVNILAVHATTVDDISISRPVHGMVNIDSGTLNVREEANTSSAIIGSLSYLGRVMIVGKEGNFYKVQYNTAGDYGYVSCDYILYRNNGYYLRANTSSGNLNMRSSAGTSYDVVASIPKGTYFAYVATIDDWYWAVYGNVSGYTSAQYTSCYAF